MRNHSSGTHVFARPSDCRAVSIRFQQSRLYNWPMNRRQLLATLATAPAATQLSAQPGPKFRFRAGLVAYSYRKEFAAKSMSYEDLIHRIADWGLDGLDCT